MSYREKLIKKLIYKSKYCGCRENDILLGEYSEAKLHKYDHKLLELYEEFIAENDLDIYNWVAMIKNTPQKYSHIIEDIINYKKKIGKIS